MMFAEPPLSPPDSLFARFDTRWKLASLLMAAGSIAVLKDPFVLAVALGLTLAVAVIARVPERWYWTRIRIVLLSLAPFLIVLPLTLERGSTVEIGGIQLFVAGFVAAAALLCKTIAIVTLMLILLSTAPLAVTLRAAQRLYVPGVFVLLVSLSYRYIFVLLDELHRLRVALRVRGFRNRANRHSYWALGQVTGTLLVRGADRAERVSHAMRCRGFDGTFRSLDGFRTTPRDVVVFLLLIAAFGGLLIFDWRV